jgi:hypothetical protein
MADKARNKGRARPIRPRQLDSLQPKAWAFRNVNSDGEAASRGKVYFLD